jgi:nucleoside-diphosphate-sugar epimerase
MSYHLVVLGAGYVGTALAMEGIRRGWKVSVLTRNETYLAEMRRLGAGTCVLADLAETSWHEQISGDVDFLVNCVSSGKGGLAGYEHSYLRGQKSLVEWASRRKVGCCIYTSSTSVYPQSDGEWIDEDSPARPSSPSGLMILKSEEILHEARHVFERLFIFRLSGIYGPDRHYILDQLRRGEINFGGRGDYYLNLIHRTDVVRAIFTAFEGPEGLVGGTYNVSDGHPYIKEEVVGWLARKLKLAAPVFHPEVLTPRQRRREVTSNTTIPNRRISSNRIRRDLGWRPLYPSYREGYADILGEI